MIAVRGLRKARGGEKLLLGLAQDLTNKGGQDLGNRPTGTPLVWDKLGAGWIIQKVQSTDWHFRASGKFYCSR